MAQREDEYHALHTIVGKTGAVPGAVALPSEGKQHVRTSIEEILPEPCRATTLWVFSDNPSTILGCIDVFPNLKGVAEDPHPSGRAHRTLLLRQKGGFVAFGS